jgi:hypothetical protein
VKHEAEMTTPVYEWKWKRAKGKFFLELLRDNKKIGSARETWQPHFCSCGPDYNCYGDTRKQIEETYPPRFVSYAGGKLVGRFHTMTDAKIAVELELGVSTKKSKKKPEPQRITTAPHVSAKKIVEQKRWDDFISRAKRTSKK